MLFIVLALLFAFVQNVDITIEKDPKTEKLSTGKLNFQFKMDPKKTIGIKDAEFIIKRSQIKPKFTKVETDGSLNKGENEESTWIGFENEIFTVNRSPSDRILIYDKQGKIAWILNEDIPELEKLKMEMILDTSNHEDYLKTGIKFAFMTDNEIIVREIIKQPDGSSKKIAIPVVNFKLEGITDVRDFTFAKQKQTSKDKDGKITTKYIEVIEVVLKNKVIIYEKDENLNRYLKNEKEEKERGDLDMKHVWKVESETNATLILNGISKLTYLESWGDNSPDELIENLYKPTPLRTQTDKVVLKSPTDNSEMTTYWIMTHPENLKLEDPSQRKTAFQKMYSFEDYDSAFVAKNYAVFFTKEKSKRIIFFGGDGTLQYDLDSLPEDLNGKKGADSVWGDENSLKIMFRDRKFSLITKHLKVDQIDISCTPEKPFLNIFPENKKFDFKLKVSGGETDLNLNWKISITIFGYILWGFALIAVLGTLIMICVLILKKRSQKRADHKRAALLSTMMIEKIPSKQEIKEYEKSKRMKSKTDLIANIVEQTKESRKQKNNPLDKRVTKKSIIFKINDDSDSHESKESEDEGNGKVTKQIIKFDTKRVESGSDDDDDSF